MNLFFYLYHRHVLLSTTFVQLRGIRAAELKVTKHGYGSYLTKPVTAPYRHIAFNQTAYAVRVGHCQVGELTP